MAECELKGEMRQERVRISGILAESPGRCYINSKQKRACQGVEHMEKWKGNKNKVTIILVALNVGVFFILSALGNTEDGVFMLNHGAIYAPYVLMKGEYYRLFTALFLHFGFAHLMNNMVMLGAFGLHLEPEMGSIRFLAAYLLSGIGGNILSLVIQAQESTSAVSAGASGAIFGLMGVLVGMLLKNRGRVGRISGQRIVLMVVLSLYFGFADSSVDNAAHIGGLITGLLCSMFLYRPRRGRRMEDCTGIGR